MSATVVTAPAAGVKRAVFLTVGALFASVLVAGLLVRAGDPATDDADTASAPAFSLPSVIDEATRVSLPAGKPTVLYFFASWCVPCREEAPIVQAASSERSDVAFVGINHLDHRDDAREFMEAHALTVPSGHDPAGAVALRYRLRGLPATVFIDASGRIVSTLHGQLDRETLDERIDQLVLQGSPD